MRLADIYILPCTILYLVDPCFGHGQSNRLSGQKTERERREKKDEETTAADRKVVIHFAAQQVDL